MKLKELSVLIDTSFANVEKPSDADVSFDERFPDSEYNAVAILLRNTERDQLDIEKLEKYGGDFTTIIFFMGLDSLLYYLPAFLRITIEHYERSENLFDSLLLLLYGGPSKEEKEYSANFRGMLTRNQKFALREYLKYMASRYPDDFHFVSVEELTQLLT